MGKTRKMLICAAALLAILAALSRYWAPVLSISQTVALVAILVLEVIVFAMIVSGSRGSVA
jgi:hypothetical protein